MEQTESNEEKVIETKSSLINLVQEKKISPYDNKVFCAFMFEDIIERYLLSVNMIAEGYKG